MPTLLLQCGQMRSGGRLAGRVLIGRKAICAVAIDDPAVSRIHAWIEPRDGGWCIGDAGGANGVYVNGERIEHWSTLSDGDEIQIGPALLTFSASSQLPRGLKLLSMQQAQTGADHSGCLITCACGTPAWVPAVLAGRQRPCVHCGQRLQEAAPLPESTCSICQCAIAAGEATHTCSDCGGTFHAACWRENFGCSSYGCPQVNRLAPRPREPVLPSAQPVFDESPPPPNPAPWEYLLLTAGVIGTVLGMLAFGGPALVVAIAALVLLWRGQAQRPVVLVASLVLSLAGAAGGILTSYAWWMR